MAINQNDRDGEDHSGGRFNTNDTFSSSRRERSVNGDADYDRRRERREYRAKMRHYKEKHREAKAVFERITGKSPETRKDAEELYEDILKRGSASERAKATFAVADFCWACDEKEAEREVREETDDYGDDD